MHETNISVFTDVRLMDGKMTLCTQKCFLTPFLPRLRKHLQSRIGMSFTFGT